MHIYFVGIGGSGLSPLAQLAIDCGYEVSGSDLQEGHGTKEIEKRNIIVNYHDNPNYLQDLHSAKPVDYIVYTAACKPYDKELLFANNNNIKVGKRDSFLNKIIAKKNLKMLAIAGTHGKTTTTAMTVWLFKQFNIPVSYLIGSNISFGPSSQYQEGSEYFVYEADEFDRNFLHYKPFASVITNIDFDHPDTYSTKQDYYKAFNEFSLQSGCTFAWLDDFDKLEHSIILNSDTIGDDIKLLGKHNRMNMYLALKLFQFILKEGVDKSKIIEIANLFPGTQRRFEKIGQNIYSDYAHHPTEVAATLQLASEISPKVVVIYQPHQNVRQHEIKDLYEDCFKSCSKIYWLPTHLSREDDSLEILTPLQLISFVKTDQQIIVSGLNEDLKSNLENDLLDPDTIVVGMGAGSIDHWIRNNLINRTVI
jgi:UDP-N-acetylmuramate--alanine ligase